MPVLGSNGFVPVMATPTSGVAPADSNTMSVVDGTPVRVVVLAFSAAAGLMALKFAGFKFNVGVSA